MNQLADHIKSIVSISDSGLELMCGKFDKNTFSKKEHLLQAKSKTHEVHFILSGCVRTYIYDLNGVEHNITFSIENWWFGD
ncbi:MAG: Crp/Fnr family transcriptional regulator, partial [Bacteroidota bacterium]